LSIDNAQRALMHLQAGIELPPDLRQWLAQGLGCYLRGEDLARGLGLAPTRGGAYTQPRAVVRLTTRDSAIRALQHWLGLSGSNWQVAGEIEALLDAHRRGESLTPALEPGHPVLHLLRQLGGESLSRRQILRILNGNRSS